MHNTKIGFIGLGNVGGKLAGSLARHGAQLIVRDLNADLEAPFLKKGACRALSPQDMAERADVVITCLPSPAACADVMEGAEGILAGLSAGKVWLEMSTTDPAEVRRLGEDLHKRLAVFAEHLGRLGKSLGSSVESFNKAVGSLEQQILPAARRFPELGLRVSRDIEPLEPLESLTRTPRENPPDEP